MAMEPDSDAAEPTREEVEQIPGPVLLEFGAAWCGYCRTLAPHLANLLRQHPDVKHIKVEDGPGQPLGRSFRVKLWPTLVLLRDGKIRTQLVRPTVQEVRDALHALAQP